ncbi:branched-chain-amino-acid aminotransferase-like protein 2, partial [Trifolium medium]|nr:branched-chain-amino-acid aminotransferase-like protein 2 [Trifolium medium]
YGGGTSHSCMVCTKVPEYKSNVLFFTVLDEPLYGNFLRVSGIDRPYKDQLLSNMESDGNKVVKDIIYGPGNSKYRFCKHISKQKVLGLPEDLMKKGKHFILIRNPLDLLPSFGKVVPPSFFELGLLELVQIYNELCDIGNPPTVIDAEELQKDPEATLRTLCNDLEIPFQPSMLRFKIFGELWPSKISSKHSYKFNVY